MGEQKVTVIRTANQSRTFINRLITDVDALEKLIENGLIEAGIQRIGAEQELCFVDDAFHPAPVINKVLSEIDDDRFTTEIASFNGEINLDPIIFSAGCFYQLEQNLNVMLKMIKNAAKKINCHVILTGIVPTIRKGDLAIKNLTPEERYSALDQSLKNLKGGGHYEFRIEGTDQLIARHDSAMFEGCNTSFQVHLQTDPDKFVSQYNWAQAVAGPILSGATNSPLLLGKRLWRETRIALFEQAIDVRSIRRSTYDRVPRVYFGVDWLKHSVTELFKEDIVRHRMILASTSEEDSLKVLEKGEIPRLKALMVHNGTVYRWNRACYGILNGKPHLRIENRYFPSGPSVIDEVSNAAFWLGVMKGQPDEYADVSSRLIFENVKSNFVRAARNGLGSKLHWTTEKKVPATELIKKELLPLARNGLKKAGLTEDEISNYLDVIAERVETEKTGSQWIVDSYIEMKQEHSHSEALVATTAGIIKRQSNNTPAHQWKPIKTNETEGRAKLFQRVEQIMSTDLFTVQPEDPISLVMKIMDWRKIRHIPVQNESGHLVGLVTSGMFLNYFAKNDQNSILAIADIMVEDPISISPEISTRTAVKIMLQNNIGCLPVVNRKKLVGIVTEHDFLKVAGRLFQELKPVDLNGN